MSEPMESMEPIENVSRRNFIKGVIAGGAATYSAGYLLRSGGLMAQPGATGAAERLITIKVNGQERQIGRASCRERV